MATVSLEETSAVGAERKRSRRRKTSHLKQVPETRIQRERLRDRCAQVVAKLDKTHPLTKDEMERVSRKLLDDEGLSESLVGWMMVNIAGEFWREQVAATPYDRRLLLLPHCLKHAEGCPADYDEWRQVMRAHWERGVEILMGKNVVEGDWLRTIRACLPA